MKLYNKNGFLTEDGKLFMSETVGYEVKKILDSAENAEEVRTLGCLLANYIGNMVCDKIQNSK